MTASVLLSPTPALAQNDMLEETFEVGGSCASLAYLTMDQLQAQLTTGFAGDHMAFCRPEEPLTCTDYTQFLRGLGRMSAGDDGYHCAVQLH